MQSRLCSSNRLEMASKRVKIIILSKKQIVISKVIKAKRLKFFALNFGFFLFCFGKEIHFQLATVQLRCSWANFDLFAFMTSEMTICFLDEMTIFTILLAISKWLELQSQDCTQLRGFLKAINLVFLKTF